MICRISSPLAHILMALFVALATSAASAEDADAQSTDMTGFQRVVAPFLQQHCLDCHGQSDPEADFSLAGIDGDILAGADAAKWAKVADKLTLGEMPPEDEPRPDSTELDKVNAWLRGELRKAGKSTVADKLSHPGYGNYVNHELLFDPPKDAPPPASPPRLWRLNPHVYSSLAYDLSRQSNFAQPFAFEAGDGIKDFSSDYGVDEPTTDSLIRNAFAIADFQMWHEYKDGNIRGGWRTPKEVLVLLDRENKKPTREQYQAMIRRQFELVLQRDATDGELERMTALMEKTIHDAGLHKGVQTTLAAVILSPEAIFRMELGGGQADEQGRVMLRPREIAYAISYALTDQRPRGDLLKAAEAGHLATKDDVRREVERMLSDPKLQKPRIMRFIHEYFGYEAAVDVFKDKEEFESHKPDVLVSDTDRLIEDILAADKNVLYELLTTNKSYVNYKWDKKKNMAVKAREKDEIHFSYNLQKWPEKQPVEFPANERAGILTQPSWLVAYSMNTENHAIRRGKWVLERLLGGTVPDLPITVDAQLPEDPSKTLRERMAVTRESYCWQCHQRMNPLGLPFEMYDHFGRFREQELDRPVDASGGIEIGDKKIDGEVENAIVMIHRLAKSERVQQVFVRHAFRYWLGRNETPADGPALLAANAAYAESGGSLNALIVSLLTSDSFLYRTVAE